jgi:hypothetical protein
VFVHIGLFRTSGQIKFEERERERGAEDGDGQDDRY